MELRYRQYDLPLRHVFTIARGSASVQTTLIVQISQNGLHGYGEATASNYYGASIEQMSHALERVRPIVESAALGDPLTVIDQLAAALPEEPFPLSALDQALHDLWGKLRGEPVYRLWGLTTDRVPQSDYTIGIDTIEKMVAKLDEMPGWPVYKIKLGTPQDLEVVQELRKHTAAVLRVDANCGWTVEQAIELAPKLRDLGVEFIEQPLPPDDIAGSRRLFAESALPVIADESCVRESDVANCQGRFHGINIKLVKCGGLAAGRRMARQARELGMKVMAGCMTESSVGISALAQLLPLLDYVDMDGAVLLARDIATGVRVDCGVCVWPDVPGTGAQLLDGPLT